MDLAWRTASGASRIVAAAVLGALAGGQTGVAQDITRGLSVAPVTFELRSGQMTSVLTIQNNTDREVDFQVRSYSWSQTAGDDHLTPTDILVASPPLGRIPAGGQQIVRLVLRKAADGQEASYRILLDQAPPPPDPGQVSFALRMSMPLFDEPPERGRAMVRWKIQSEEGAYYLVAVNRGGRHEAFRDVALTTASGRPVPIEQNASPYVLAGATRRWRILSTSFAPSREALQLTARAESGPVDQPVSALSAGP